MAAVQVLDRPTASNKATSVASPTPPAIPEVETPPTYVGTVQVVRELEPHELLERAWDHRHCYASKRWLYGVYANGKRVCVPDHQAELMPGMRVTQQQLDRWAKAWADDAPLPSLLG